MSMSMSKSNQKTASRQQTDPWDETIDPLKQLIGSISGQQGNFGATPGQTDAFAQLEQNAGQGNPYEGQIGQLAGDLFGGVDPRSGQIEDAYNKLYSQIGDTAAGKNLDVNENPYIQTMLQNNANDIQQRINGQFAGAGRDLSGKNQESLARGISEGTIPALFNQYNLERTNQTNAANTLFGAGSGAATAEQGLDLSALNNRLQGIPTAQAYLDAQNYGPNTMLTLEQQQKQLPMQDLGVLEGLLGPLAQLGSQSTGNSKTSGTTVGGKVDFGSLIGGLLGSDERIKDDKEEVGKLADGTPIYRYSYKGDPTGKTQIGVMAQDIEDDNPDAVAEIGGIKMVDYAKATDKAAAKMKQKKRGGGY